jgi:hypothetical protein
MVETCFDSLNVSDRRRLVDREQLPREITREEQTDGQLGKPEEADNLPVSFEEDGLFVDRVGINVGRIR